MKNETEIILVKKKKKKDFSWLLMKPFSIQDLEDVYRLQINSPQSIVQPLAITLPLLGFQSALQLISSRLGVFLFYFLIQFINSVLIYRISSVVSLTEDKPRSSSGVRHIGLTGASSFKQVAVSWLMPEELPKTLSKL